MINFLYGCAILLLFFISQTEKVDLENTLVDESQRQLKEQEASSRLRKEKGSGMI